MRKLMKKKSYRFQLKNINPDKVDISEDALQQLSKFLIGNGIVNAIINAQKNGDYVIIEIIPKHRNPPENIAELVHDFVETKIDPL